MNVLGINGSPHRNGNTAYALRHALQVIEQQDIETAYFSLADLNLTPCDGCFVCRNGTCVHDDDMTPIYEALRRCDGLILASPVYMGLITGLHGLDHRSNEGHDGSHRRLSHRRTL